MNFTLKIIALISFPLLLNNSLHAQVAIRSQTVDASRTLVGWTQYAHLALEDESYGAVAVIPQYTRSFHNNKLMRCLLGSDCISEKCGTPTIHISGSAIDSRDAKDWLADYFGLPNDYQSTITFNPVIDSFQMDFALFLGLNSLCDGLFLTMQAPIVHLRTRLEMSECIANAGVNDYPAGYFAPTAVSRDNLLSSFEDFIGNSAAPTIVENSIHFNSLCNAKWATPVSEKQEHTALSDIELILGYDYFLQDDYHLGAGLLLRAPTGNRIDSAFIFEPQVGNGHHFELGGMITGHYTFWRNEDTCRSLRFSLDGYFTHLFATTQCRTFDLKNNGCSSKYMLAQKVTRPVGEFLFGNGTNVPGGPTADTTKPSAQFQNVYAPVANLTTTRVKVSNAAQVDIAAMLTYQHNNHTYDFGYDFWFRSKDKICLTRQCGSQIQQWALKGDAFVYGFGASNATIGANENIALSATQSEATIFAGTNRPVGAGLNTSAVSEDNQRRNPGVDNPEFGVTSGTIANTTDRSNYASGLVAADLNQQRISNPPILLTEQDLDIAKQEVQALSHKFFAHINYNWPDEWCILPYVGIGGFVELGRTSQPDCNKTCSNTVTNKADCCGLSQWAVWLKTGFGF